ncbi:MAG: efflux RND transporter periplasmic adaptor subunit [Akkermansia sp.]
MNMSRNGIKAGRSIVILLIVMGLLPVNAIPTTMAPKLSKVLVQKAVEKDDIVNRKYIGRLEAVDKVKLQARISGNIVKTFFKEGDIVKKGQILFEIEDVQYRANVQSAEAKLKQLDAELKYATNNFMRLQKMEAKQVVSRDTMESSLSLMQSLEAKKLSADADLTTAKFDLSHTKIVAPMTGRIGRETYSEGNFVTPASEPLATIMMTDPIYVRFPLSERDYLSLFGNSEKMRNEAVIRLKLADGSMYQSIGKVAIGDNEIKSGTDTINVWAEFDNPNFQLTTGGIVTVLLSKSEKRTQAAVLISGVMTDEKGNYLYVIDEKNRANRRDVKLGSIQGNMQLIESGLNVGETVIIDGTHKVLPGKAVVPIMHE